MRQPRTILIVEDDTSLRLFWRAALRAEGFDVMMAGDGIDALRLVEQRLPDLIVLDLGLPRLDGASVQQEMAAQTMTRHIPVLIVTGSTNDLSYLDVPCVLRKPVGADRLVEAVRTCLRAGPPAVCSSLT